MTIALRAETLKDKLPPLGLEGAIANGSRECAPDDKLRVLRRPFPEGGLRCADPSCRLGRSEIGVKRKADQIGKALRA
jgi:hypothetical protein